MALSDSDIDEINSALQAWRQGDVTLDEGLEFIHLGDLKRPGTEAAELTAAALLDAEGSVPDGPIPLADAEVRGLAVLSQTCDIVRNCRERPYIEVAPIVEVSSAQVEAARRLKTPAFAYVPSIADRCLVAHVDRVMTVEKSLVARWSRVPGWQYDNEARIFAQTLARKRARFAFPDAFTEAARKLARRIIDKHNKNTEEGLYLRALDQIRVRAAPSWDDDKVILNWWFIKIDDPKGVADINWVKIIDQWMSLFEKGDKYVIDTAIACFPSDMNGQDYIESDVLELEYLSTSRDI